MPNNSNPALINTPKEWACRASTANSVPDASTTTGLVSLVTGASNGTRIDRVTFVHAPAASTSSTNTAGQVRFYLKVGSTYRLLKEIIAASVIRTAILPGFTGEWNRGDGTPVAILNSGDELVVGTEKGDAYDFFAAGGDY